jgi:hypothetical protein
MTSQSTIINSDRSLMKEATVHELSLTLLARITRREEANSGGNH